MATTFNSYFSDFNRACNSKSSRDLADLVSNRNEALVEGILDYARSSSKLSGSKRKALTITDELTELAGDSVRQKNWSGIAAGCCLVAYNLHVTRDLMQAYREQNALAQYAFHVLNFISDLLTLNIEHLID